MSHEEEIKKIANEVLRVKEFLVKNRKAEKRIAWNCNCGPCNFSMGGFSLS